jgi:hypothetical protein
VADFSGPRTLLGVVLGELSWWQLPVLVLVALTPWYGIVLFRALGKRRNQR